MYGMNARFEQDGLEAYLPMAGLVDKDKERARLDKQAQKLEKDIEVLEKRLGGSNFVEKVLAGGSQDVSPLQAAYLALVALAHR